MEANAAAGDEQPEVGSPGSAEERLKTERADWHRWDC